MKEPKKPPHGPLCKCGWLIPIIFNPAEWAPFEESSVVVECPMCRAWLEYSPPILSFEEAEKSR